MGRMPTLGLTHCKKCMEEVWHEVENVTAQDGSRGMKRTERWHLVAAAGATQTQEH